MANSLIGAFYVYQKDGKDDVVKIESDLQASQLALTTQGFFTRQQKVAETSVGMVKDAVTPHLMVMIRKDYCDYSGMTDGSEELEDLYISGTRYGIRCKKIYRDIATRDIRTFCKLHGYFDISSVEELKKPFKSLTEKGDIEDLYTTNVKLFSMMGFSEMAQLKDGEYLISVCKITPKKPHDDVSVLKVPLKTLCELNDFNYEKILAQIVC
jgi:hypothetical protein